MKSHSGTSSKRLVGESSLSKKRAREASPIPVKDNSSSVEVEELTLDLVLSPWRSHPATAEVGQEEDLIVISLPPHELSALEVGREEEEVERF
ncbi:hypothetical protein J5N97_029961 [Dioscorea zingiberensis]|uniref:Uncharacterized protein n=1 Tax=Dioscorea zingiberensis TaxID=325984 RepID=A0A9D5H3P2_9LILI|nr:hypothetical protein J5N97_029961 [Dioscorea zingiberensis]